MLYTNKPSHYSNSKCCVENISFGNPERRNLITYASCSDILHIG